MTSLPPPLQRFLKAQDHQPTGDGVTQFQHAVGELRFGAKRSHWMWFIFPQIEGLGGSANARKYAITSKSEATNYLNDSALGPRYFDCLDLVAGHVLARPGAVDVWATLLRIFGEVDARKFKSSVTLFGDVASNMNTAISMKIAGLARQIHSAGLRPCPDTLDWLAKQN